MICSDWSTDCLITISSIMIAGITASALTISIHLTKNQLKQTAKIEEQKFFLAIDEVFARPDNVTIRYMINDEVHLGKPIDTTVPENARMIDNYLNHLEFICSMYEQKIISKYMTDAFVGMRISNVLKCGSIKLYISDERINNNEPKLWEAVKRVGKEFESTF